MCSEILSEHTVFMATHISVANFPRLLKIINKVDVAFQVSVYLLVGQPVNYSFMFKFFISNKMFLVLFF